MPPKDRGPDYRLDPNYLADTLDEVNEKLTKLSAKLDHVNGKMELLRFKVATWGTIGGGLAYAVLQILVAWLGGKRG